MTMRSSGESAIGLTILGLTLLSGACAAEGVSFSDVDVSTLDDAYANWSFTPDEAEALLARVNHFDSAKRAGKGTQGAMKVTTRLESQAKELVYKWKSMPKGLEGWNNSPRRELLAYEIQRLFLDPEDFVVPTTLVRCMSVEAIKAHIPKASVNVKGANCIFSVVSLWLNEVRSPKSFKDLYDEQRFRKDPLYAHYLSNFNLVTFLIDHRDGVLANFLLANDDKRRQVFSPDNGLSLGASPYNFFLQNWNRMRVPAVRKSSIDRLRALTRSDLDVLAVLAQFEADEQGNYKKVQSGKSLDANSGVRVGERTVQFGLTKNELDQVYQRIREVANSVDQGTLGVF